MKTFYILAVICIAGIYAHPDDRKIIQCSIESNFNFQFHKHSLLAYMDKVRDGVIKPTEEYYCFVACAIENQDNFTGSVHDFIMQRVANADEQEHFENKPYTREDLENVGKKCAHKGLNGCDYLKCIKYLETPFSQLPFDA